MKTIFNSFLTVLMIFVFTSCSHTQVGKKSIRKQVGQEIVVQTMISPQNSCDTRTSYRAVSNGVSSDWNVAKGIAVTNARGTLAIKIKSRVRTAMENYTKQYATSTETNTLERDLTQMFEQYVLNTTDVMLVDVNEIENHTSRNSKTLAYTYWVALEINKNTVIEGVVKGFDRIPSNKKAQIKTDRDEFRKYLQDKL